MIDDAPLPPQARRVEWLDVESLPPGEVTRLLVELVDDGLGRPIRVPVLVARGARPGPVFGLTAALHGNEINGIPVLQRLFAGLDPQRIRGTVVGVLVVNVPGFLLHQREFNDGRDLNHLMPGKRDGSVSEQYAHRLVDRVVRHFNFLVDLHTASTGRVNSLYVRADLKNPTTARMAGTLRPEIALHNPASDRTLRGTAMELGIPAVTLEIGNPQRFQKRYIKDSLAGLQGLMGEFGLLPKRKASRRPGLTVCSRSSWLYTRTGGLLEVFPEVRDRVEKGERVAQLRTVFGDVAEEYFAPVAGVVIGKSTDPVGPAGARILHLGVLGVEQDAFLLDGHDEEAAPAPEAGGTEADEPQGSEGTTDRPDGPPEEGW